MYFQKKRLGKTVALCCTVAPIVHNRIFNRLKIIKIQPDNGRIMMMRFLFLNLSWGVTPASGSLADFPRGVVGSAVVGTIHHGKSSHLYQNTNKSRSRSAPLGADSATIRRTMQKVHKIVNICPYFALCFFRSQIVGADCPLSQTSPTTQNKASQDKAYFAPYRVRLSYLLNHVGIWREKKIFLRCFKIYVDIYINVC